MSNLHATQLEKVLTARGLTIVKGARDWQISTGGGKSVTYVPATGVCKRFDPLLGANKRDPLRGSPDRVAEILEGFVR